MGYKRKYKTTHAPSAAAYGAEIKVVDMLIEPRSVKSKGNLVTSTTNDASFESTPNSPYESLRKDMGQAYLDIDLYQPWNVKCA
jgi:hypothetical protein